ncbi:unnamed protein product [Sphagnum troendelagicum]|uniref:25S rRNA (uridine-N(3))-methyltransferase BMT5-like domain-containing protein n=1 Tax=Sphagnum troendelagicum TaxID=128251 RepID=A0ABP0TWI8_9BRYO
METKTLRERKIKTLKEETKNEKETSRLKRISQYSNNQLILLVGEGDFSFSLALATAFGAAHNIVATSLDSRDEVLLKYGQNGAANLCELERRGAQVLHGVDVRNMSNPYQSGLGDRLRLFDRIIYNFPHAGFTGPENLVPVIKRHKELIGLFFENAAKMLLHGGEVHVTHKLGPPYDQWGLVEQAQASGLDLKDNPQEFHRSIFPGYCNRRGAYCIRTGALPRATFGLGKCATFMFHSSSKCVQRKESIVSGLQLQRIPAHCVQDSMMCNTPLSNHLSRIHRQQVYPGIPIFPDNMRDEYCFRDTLLGHSPDHFQVLHTIAPLNLPVSNGACHFSKYTPQIFYSTPMNWGF